MVGLLFGLGAALTWGIADYFAGIVSRRLAVPVLAVVMQAVALVCYGIVMVLAGLPSPTWSLLWPGLATGFAFAAAQLTFFRALSLGTMGIVAPISATGAAVPVLVALARGEAPGPIALAGVLVAGVGIFLACRRDEAGEHPACARDEHASILWAFAAALAIGALLVGLDIGSQRSLGWTLVSSRATALVALGVWCARLGVGPGHIRGEWPLLVGIGLLNAAAGALYAQGTRVGLLSIVAMSATLHSIVTALLAAWLLHERMRPVQRVGVGLATLAVVGMASGQ